MDFLDKISSFTKNAADKAGNMIDVTRLHSKINAEQAKIAELERQIGQYYFEEYLSQVPLPNVPAEYCTKIVEHNGTIAALEAEIQSLQGNTQESTGVQNNPQPPNFCPNCGQNLIASTKFCPNCGHAIGK